MKRKTAGNTGSQGVAQRVTLMDVAREAGVAVSTVSLVLNDAPLAKNLAAKTRERVRAVAKRMGYRPDAFARSLRSRRSQTIGIMVFDISDPFCTLILKGIEKELHDTSYLPIIMDAHNEPKQFERYLEMLLARHVEGLIVVANWLFVDIHLISDLPRQRIPTVLVGRQMESDSISSVMVDNEAGGYAAIEHLHALGHGKIAILLGPGVIDDSAKRWAGMQRYASENGLKLDARLTRELTAAADPLSVFAEGKRLTAELLKGKLKFTAIAAFDDLTALGAVRALREAGLRVPEDCSVIGFDDVPPAALTSPGLTTIRQPMEEMGQIAAARLLRGMEAVAGKTEVEGEHLLLAPAVVVRESSAGRTGGRASRKGHSS